MTDHPPYRRTVAVMERIFGGNIGNREFIWLLILCQVASLVIGAAAFLMLPTPALIVFTGLLIAALIWMVTVARAYTRRSHDPH